MEAKDKTTSSSPNHAAELSMSEKRAENGSEVVVDIRNSSDSSSLTKQSKMGSPQKAPSTLSSCPSPEIARFSPSPNKPPKIPTSNTNIETANLTRRKTLNRSVFSRPKSRFGEPSVPLDPALFEETHAEPAPSAMGSPTNAPASRSVSLAQKSVADEEEDEEIYKKVKLNKEKRRKVKAVVVVEWVLFLFLVSCLAASLSVKELHRSHIWGLEPWKWIVLVMVIFCGMLVTKWFMNILVFVIERNFLLRKKVLYFVHGLKKSVQVFIWLCLILLTWVLVFNHGIHRSKTAAKILDYVTWTLVSLLVGAFLWLIKTTLLKILASNFHVNTFFDRIQESIFHQYVLQTLSGRPVIEEAERVGRVPSMGQLSFRAAKKGKVGKGGTGKETIDMARLHKMKQEKVSAWTMKVLVDAVASSGLSTISNTLDEMENSAEEQTDKEITSEMEATAAAYHIFRNVAQPGAKSVLIKQKSHSHMHMVFVCLCVWFLLIKCSW